jgi:putative transport protein
MEWLSNLSTKYPEMGVYLAIGIGYLVGRLKFRGVGLGVVTGSLLGGILIGNFFHVPVSDQAKSMLFLLFLFGIGYSVGPGFFRSLKGDGWRWAVLGVFVPVMGLLAAYAVARILHLDPGYAAGLLSGSLTESPAIGTASEAIRALSISAEQKDLWVSHIAVADAICYIFGTMGVIWCCSSLGPNLLRFDLRAESKKVEANLGIVLAKAGVQSAWQAIGCRAYKIPDGGPSVGKTVAETEAFVPGARIFVERIRRDGEIFTPLGTTVLQAGDIVAILGRTEVLVKVLGPTASEIADPELLNIPVASFDLYVTSKRIAGRTLQDIAENLDEAHGILLNYVLRVNPALLMGAIAGAQTMIAGVAAVQEKSDSPVATLGYSCTTAFGHIFLTTWGTIIVSLMT